METKNTLYPKLWMGIAAIVVYMIVATVIVFHQVTQRPTKQNELDIIQSIIENIDIYQEDIEAWGYHVSVLTLTEKPENKSLQRYYQNHYYHPVLVLTDADGGMYCFYYGFDEYTSVVSYPAMVNQLYGKYEEALKTVRLELYKREPYQAPFLENPHDAEDIAYYDVEVETHVSAFSVAQGKEIWADFESGFNYAYYCSNNFVDCRRFQEHNPEEANRNADHSIKKEYSAEQLLGFYQQGIALQERLFALYDENTAESSEASSDGYSQFPAKPMKDAYHSASSPGPAVAPDVQPDTQNHKHIRSDEYRIDLHKARIPTTEQNKTALAAEIMQIKNNRTYHLFLEKKTEPEACLSISVYTSGGDKLQTIKEKCNVFSPYYLDRILTFDDFNCDGYADMAVIVYEGAMNVIYQLYVWSPNEEQFVKVACDEPLYDPEVQDGMVVDVAKAGAAGLECTYFIWENESTLVKVSSETVALEDSSS